MKWSAFTIGLTLALGLAATDVAWAERSRGGHQFQQRHDGFKYRSGGYSHHRAVINPRYDRHRYPARVVPVHRGGGSRSYRGTTLGISIGMPLYWHWPSPYYAYPPAVVTVPAPPPVYIERGYEDSPAREAGYWYYCERPEGYYPYVKECSGGWMRVAPTPPR